MEEPVVFMESLYEKIKEYGITNAELIKFKAVDKAARVLSSLIVRLITFFFALMFLLALNIAVALWVGSELGKSYYGFLIVAGFYCLVGLVIHFFMRDWIKKQIGNSIVEHILN